MKSSRMKSSSRMVRLALTGAILGLTCAARAQSTLYQTGFESPDYTAGQPINGQNNWMEFNSSGAALVTTSQPASGQQSVQINGSALSFLPMYGLYISYTGPIQTWNFSQYPIVRLDTDVCLDGPSTGSTIDDDLMSADLTIGTQSNTVAQMWISSDGHVQYLSGADYGPGPAYDGYLGPAVALGQYYDLTILLNAGNLTDSFYVDGQFLGSLAMPTSAISDDSFFFNLSMVGVADQPGYDHTQYTAYFDNVNLTSVPEPGVPALLVGLFGAAGALRVWRRRPSSRKSGCR